jgi:hypothetical protein
MCIYHDTGEKLLAKVWRARERAMDGGKRDMEEERRRGEGRKLEIRKLFERAARERRKKERETF